MMAPRFLSRIVRFGRLAALAGACALSAAAAAQAAAPVRDGWISANGTSLHYRIEGRAGVRPVILLHEIGMALQSWDDVAPGLAARHQVIRYDLRGSGLSQVMGGGESLDTMVADLGGLLDALGIHQPVDLVGSALGGSIALAFAADHPERVHRLIVLSPVFNVGSPPRMAGAGAPPGASPATLLVRDGVRAYLTPERIAAIYPPALQADRARFARFLGLQLASEPNSRAIDMKIANERDFAPVLPKVAVPTLLVATAQFALRSPAMIDGFARLMPQGRSATLDTGHLAPLEDPDGTAKLIEKELAAKP